MSTSNLSFLWALSMTPSSRGRKPPVWFLNSSPLCFTTSCKSTVWEHRWRDAAPDWRQREGTMGSCNNGSGWNKPGVCGPPPPPLRTHSPCETIWCMYCCSHLSIKTGGRAARPSQSPATRSRRLLGRALIKTWRGKKKGGSWSLRGFSRSVKMFWRPSLCLLMWRDECQRLVSLWGWRKDWAGDVPVGGTDGKKGEGMWEMS